MAQLFGFDAFSPKEIAERVNNVATNPQAMRLIKRIDDGENAKQFTFETIDFVPRPAAIGQFCMIEVLGFCSAPFTFLTLLKSALLWHLNDSNGVSVDFL